MQLGELDTEAVPNDCTPRLQEQKDRGAPVEVIVHKNATHNWDEASLANKTFRKKGLVGQDIVYHYNPKVTADLVKSVFAFLDRHLRAN